MSSSFRNLPMMSRIVGLTAVLGAGALLSNAQAADTYFRPLIMLGGEYASNRSLNPNSDAVSGVGGYNATAEALFGVRTPRSVSEFRPRIRYQAFPSNKDFDQTEGTLDFKSTFKTVRSEFEVVGKYSQQDEFNAEFSNVGFDPFDPNAPDPATSGQILVSEKRKRAEVRPSFVYRWSETMGVGADLLYQDVRYTADVPLDREDYDNVQGNLNLIRRISRKTELSGGAYVGRYQTKDDLHESDSVGLAFSVGHDWTTQHHSELDLSVERGKAKTFGAVPGEETSTDWGLEFSTVRKGEISRLRFVIGRDLTPSGSGGRATRDQVRAQYERDLSQRMTLTTALRAYRQRSLSNNNTNTSINRDAATLELTLNYQLSTTWFISGGYGLTWQDRKNSTAGSATNNRLLLQVGYRGLDPTRRR